MASSPSKTEQCLFCSMSESMSEDVNWVQCGKCQHWAHFSCAGVDQGVVNSDWRCPQCLPSSAQQLKVPDAAAKKRSKKSGQRSDGGSDLGAGSDVDPIEKQLEEEQLAKEKTFAKQMAARKKLLARQKAWKEEQQRQEQEMRELELQVQREMEEQQLEHEQKLLDAQLAAEQAFVKKREAIRRQFTSSVNRVNALKGQESAVGEASEDHPKKRVKEWLKDQSAAVVKPSTADFRGAYPKGDEQFGAGCSTQVGKPKPMSKVPVITEFEAGTSEDSDSDGDSSSDESFKDVRAESSRRGSLRRSRVADGPGPRVGRIYGEQLDDRAESSRHSSLRRSRGAEGPGPSVGRISREQLAARKAVSQHLPKFRGEAEVWPLFISSFEYTTAACGFSNLENVKRLQDCLQGDALEAVRSRLVLPDSVPDVIADLRNLFGKPEKLLKTLLTKVRNAPAPRADRLETFISFGITVKQLCDHLEAAQLSDHLNNPMLVQELVDKLPPSYKLDWVRYKRGRVDSPLRMFTRFTTDIVSDVSEVTEFSTLSVNERTRPGRENPRKKEFVHVHESERKQSEGSRNEMASRPCWICKRTDHLIRNCDEFRRMNVAERLREVERQKLCGICLNKHSGGRCSSKIRCMMRNCQGGHHPLLHRVEESVQLQKAKSDCTVIFRMMSVTLYVGKRQYDTVAFLDEGSSATLVDDAVAKRLKAEGTLEPLIVTWTGNINRFENESRTVEISMSAKGSKEKYPLFNTRTVSELQLPKQNIRYAEVVKRYSHLAGVPAKDFPSGVPTILIGLDNLHLFAPLESRVGKPNEPIAVRSKMGWTIYGSEKRRPMVQTYLNLHSVAPVSNQELHDMMREQYVLEEAPITSFAVPEPSEEKRARKIFESTTKRVGNRFETGLLWRSDERRFPDSYPMADRRMKALDRKLERSPALKENVCRQIEEYQSKGYAHKATEVELAETPQGTAWYLPLNVVVNPRKPGKVRLVWDAAASVNGISLNSELLKGPDMLVPLPRVICHFRKRPIAFGGDIQEMYHQIRIRSEDKQAQRFLFRANSDEAPQVYVMDVATFGSTCSPSSAQYVKNLNAEQYSEQYPEAAVAIVKRHYVDDYYDSVDTVEEAIQRASEVKYVHSRGGFHIRNWVSNSEAVLEELGERSRETVVHFSLDKSTEYERVLGIVWDTVEDTFCFATASKPEYSTVLRGGVRPTKRIVLSIVMAQFDPMGFLAPVTILGKMLIQDLWRTGCQWDDVVDDAAFNKWKRWTNILAEVRAFKFPRSYFGSARSEEIQDVQLHVFADASETAYGCVAYFRAMVRGEVMCALVTSRAKVAPLKQLSIPRLELLAAVLAARMSQTVRENHNFVITKVAFWVDAEVVLSWIRSDQRRYKQFVGFRIGEILSLTRLADWRWVPTKLNVADQLTKWGKDPDTKPSSAWVRGQQFLYESEEDWPRKNMPPANTTEELRVHLLLHDVKVPAVLVDANRFSKWTILVRTIACVFRFVSNCRRKKERLPTETLRATSGQLKVRMASTGASVRIPLKQEEYEKAERCLLKVAQSESFIDELKVLLKNKDRSVDRWMAIERSSPLYKLTPMIDEDGLIRIEGRTERAEFLPFDLRFPVILPDNHRITQLIVQHYHERSGHGYRQAVKNELRQLFYILHVDAVVRKVAASCVWCKVHRCRPETPRMAALPVQRLTPNLRPFSYVGVDYLGPFDVTIGRRTEKRWIALFTCMVTRAVHLEVAFGLTTQSCLMAIHRFIGRRGWPVEFFSDNGTNLRGASKEVVESVQGISDDCADQLTNARTKWTFNPPAAPHMGGVWERLVRSVKEALTALDDGRRLTDEILQTAIVEAEDIINSRPLTYLSQSVEAEALTPNHFLRGASPNQPCVTRPSPQPAEALRDAFQRSQQLASVIWERWIKEYVPSLNQRTKWFGESRPLRVGEVVYVVEGANRKCWVRGVVEEVIASGDGRIRQAWVRTSTGRYKRAAVKLARMEIDSGNPEPEVASGTELRAGECSGSTARAPVTTRHDLDDEAASVH
ncbi:uncharacterized protein LOC109417163 [Aedes albopictus]|uniref:Pro-Pol polyprotein n=1 Tax=Aedes albopictus TaxID=7160 RepID=A0ABM1Y6Z0_AEDAL